MFIFIDDLIPFQSLLQSIQWICMIWGLWLSVLDNNSSYICVNNKFCVYVLVETANLDLKLPAFYAFYMNYFECSFFLSLLYSNRKKQCTNNNFFIYLIHENNNIRFDTKKKNIKKKYSQNVTIETNEDVFLSDSFLIFVWKRFFFLGLCLFFLLFSRSLTSFFFYYD